MKNYHVIAAVVTRNRLDLLKRCLRFLDQQTYPLSEILVINNGSSDDTLNFLKKNNYSFINQNNLGSAGGWNSAIKYFLETNHDYIWLMDDDGFPDKNALFSLLKNFKPQYSCLSSTVVQENNIKKFVFPMSLLLKNGEPRFLSFKRKEKYLDKIFIDKETYNYAHLFNGALIDKIAIKKIGNVNLNYFISGDELDYYYRLKSVGQVKTLKSALHYHPNVENRKFSEIWIYYYLKNTLIINKKYRNLVFLRNFATILRLLERVMTKNGLIFFFKFLFSKKIFIFFKAIKRGIEGKLEKDF